MRLLIFVCTSNGAGIFGWNWSFECILIYGKMLNKGMQPCVCVCCEAGCYMACCTWNIVRFRASTVWYKQQPLPPTFDNDHFSFRPRTDANSRNWWGDAISRFVLLFERHENQNRKKTSSKTHFICVMYFVLVCDLPSSSSSSSPFRLAVSCTFCKVSNSKQS